MSKNIAGTTENVSVMPALVPINDIGNNYVEIELGWHLQKHLELDDFRIVFGSQNVQFDQALIGRLNDPLANSKMRNLTMGCADSTDLQLGTIKPAVFWPRSSKPVVTKRRLQSSWKNQVA